VPDSQVVVDTLAIALQMALDGAGVALVNGPFAERELMDGRLVRLTSHQVRCPGGWGLICRQDMRDNDRVRVFMDWFASNAAAPGTA
jgi:LysR family glycine cleavage system transcriptional activator